MQYALQNCSLILIFSSLVRWLVTIYYYRMFFHFERNFRCAQVSLKREEKTKQGALKVHA